MENIINDEDNFENLIPLHYNYIIQNNYDPNRNDVSFLN